MLRRALELFEHMGGPRQKMVSKIFFKQFRLMARDPRHEQQHKAYMVFGGLFVSLAGDAISSHPGAQSQRGLAENHAFPIRVHGTPGRHGHGARSNEKPAIFPNQRFAIGVFRAFAHSCERLLRPLFGEKRAEGRSHKSYLIVTIEHI